MNIQIGSCDFNDESVICIDYNPATEELDLEIVDESGEEKNVSAIKIELNQLLASLVCFDTLRNLEEDYLTRMEE